MAPPDVVFTTTDIRPADRLTRLRGTLSNGFVGLELAARTPRAFEGTMSSRELDGVQIARFVGTPIAAFRTRRQIAAAPRDEYLVGLQMHGLARAVQDGRRVVLRPGDLALFDSARPYAIELGGGHAFEHVVFRIPRVRLADRCRGLERATAVGVPATSTAGRLVSPYLQTLASPTLRTGAPAFLEAGLDLMAEAFAGAVGHPEVDDAWRRVERETRRRLSDPELAPGVVAAATDMSVRQLHRLFAREGTTFGTWVRDQRLRRCRADLADPLLGETSIAEIARRWGWRSAPHFTRSFTRHFGVRPSDVRRGALA